MNFAVKKLLLVSITPDGADEPQKRSFVLDDPLTTMGGLLSSRPLSSLKEWKAIITGWSFMVQQFNIGVEIGPFLTSWTLSKGQDRVENIRRDGTVETKRPCWSRRWFSIVNDDWCYHTMRALHLQVKYEIDAVLIKTHFVEAVFLQIQIKAIRWTFAFLSILLYEVCSINGLIWLFYYSKTFSPYQSPAHKLCYRVWYMNWLIQWNHELRAFYGIIQNSPKSDKELMRCEILPRPVMDILVTHLCSEMRFKTRTIKGNG